MRLPRVAIVGRPNVGKSSLLNMLARQKVSIVDPTPGVTRDRVSAVVELDDPTADGPGRLVEIVDTGGYGVYTAEGGRYDDAGEDLSALTGQIEAQIAAAVENADLILFVLDAQAGITSLDDTVAQLLRERTAGGKRRASEGKGAGKSAGGERPAVPVQVVANKVDADKWEAHGLELAALGLGEPWLVSAKVNYMRREFRDRLHARLASVEAERGGFGVGEDESGGRPEMKVALLGRRNAGKSSFVNALAGEERVIVSEIAGTTRDAVDVRFEMDGRTMVAIDTAGVRKRSKFADAVEVFANMRAKASVERADVVLLLIDATQRISGIDKRLGAFVAEHFKPCVIVVTKWDLAAGRKNRKGEPVSAEDYQAYIEKELPGLATAPIVFTSSAEGRGLGETVSTAFELMAQARQRMTTSQVNKVLKSILERRGPSSKLGTKAKIYFASQVAVEPPTIVMVVNKPELFERQYERYLLNRLRELTPFTEVPIRLLIRARKRADLADLKSGRHRREQEERRAMEAAASEPVKGRAFPGIEGVDEETIEAALREEGE
jgi:GTP-binding protein